MATSEMEVAVMDFSAPFPLDPPPPGWRHRQFWTRGPMKMSFTTKDDIPAIRLETDGTASMLLRRVDIDLQHYPTLAWRWYVEQPIRSPLDERTRAGDDHPARLFIALETTSGDTRRMEIIWGNKLRAGDYKFIGAFPHYVANGGEANLHRWFAEEVDLLAIYRRLWPDETPARIVEIGLFADSDETRSHSASYFADVRVKRRTY
ncbi:MAG: DUF3047 domain-containing protein [Rhodospirillales bacterium]|nr:DUF3047 domain-containing protein [Rhodospirillales bacterium]